MKQNIAILGCGNLGLSLVTGLLKNDQFDPVRLAVSKRRLSPIRFLADQGVQLFETNREAISDARLVVLAVKPYDVKTILEEIKVFFDPSPGCNGFQGNAQHSGGKRPLDDLHQRTFSTGRSHRRSRTFFPPVGRNNPN